MKISSKKTPGPSHSRPSKQSLYVGTLAVVIVLATALATWYFRPKHAQAPSTAPDVSQSAKEVISQAYGFQATNNFSQAYQALDAALAKSRTDTEKAVLYNEKSIAALNAKDYGLALDAAKQSDKLNPTISSAHIIAASSEQLGDKATAIEYLGKQIDRMTKSGDPYIQEDLDALRAKITELKAGT